MSATSLMDDALLNWRANKGIGTFLVPAPLDDRCLVLFALQRIYAGRPDCITLVATGNFDERTDLVEFITHQDNEDNNKEFSKLLDERKLIIYSTRFLDTGKFIITPLNCIIYHPRVVTEECLTVIARCNFRLVIQNTLPIGAENFDKLYFLAPRLPGFEMSNVDEVRTSTPVEESMIGIHIPTDTKAAKLLEYYNEYITSSIKIFGSFDNIKLANKGDDKLNISATSICTSIAKENGWNEHLDMSTEFNRQIDAIYNPTNIRERASQTYEMIRNRAKLLSDYEGKLDVILDLVNKHRNDRILIISKRGQFAAIITDFINLHSESIICGNYHDYLEPIPATDDDGNPVFYKSGKNKGERRTMGAQAQQTRNAKYFREGRLTVLSTNNAPDKSLAANVDVIIITSPLCEEIESFMYRLSELRYPKGVITLYTIYVEDTLESKKLENRTGTDTHKIVKNSSNNEKSSESSNYVVVD